MVRALDAGTCYPKYMEFRRINNLPPYVFTIINDLKIEGRRNGDDIMDFGFGNPDLPSPDIAVEKLCEAAQNPRNHRYSLSRGLPKLREAICELYENKFGVQLDPETEAINTIGAKEGLSHLMWLWSKQAMQSSFLHPLTQYTSTRRFSQERKLGKSPYQREQTFLAQCKKDGNIAGPNQKLFFCLSRTTPRQHVLI